MSFRRRISILPGLHLNLSKSGVSASVGPHGTTINKKLMSTSPSTDEPVTESKGGFSIKGFIMAVIGIGLLFTGELPWWAMIISGLFGLTGAMLVLIETAENPSWLWFFPIISIMALYNGNNLPWWQLGLFWLAIIAGAICLIVKLSPSVCLNCNGKITDKDNIVCPHCNNVWNIKLDK